MVRKILLTPVLIIFACGLAGLYGAVHNQISYTVSPEYFHGFKFDQFAFDPEWRTRLGASRIGLLASWWMGLMIGVPIAVIGLITPNLKEYLRGFLQASFIVVAITFVFGLIALAYGYVAFSENDLPDWVRTWEHIEDQLAFGRAGTMHNASYLAGAIGLVVGSIYMLSFAIHHRRLLVKGQD